MENKNIFAENLKKFMAMEGKTRKDLSEALGISYFTVTSWVNGKKYPRMDKVEMLANYFGISKSDLIEDNVDALKNANASKDGIRIPVLGTVQAGIPIEAIEDVVDWEEIPESMARTGDFFGLKVKGSSMEPRFLEGDTVIVRKQPNIESGEIAIVLVNGNEATMKRVVKHKHGISLIALNAAVYEPRFFTVDEIENLPVRIVGKVVELRGKL